ncbi:hypothetical protein F53441_8958 [Fusarium austroafricanum]|uniref:Mid2 domain-containing protein n=1 Tax=Fusarium austroafricanum TaxID=2364996 RepID=A0A8H4KEC1_9HYPO|nr:hypothetical protein F53441_8958 [Fusarium austroafricanum]
MAVPLAACYWDDTSDSDYIDQYYEPERSERIQHAAYYDDYDDYDVGSRGYKTPEDLYEEEHDRAARLRASQEAIAQKFDTIYPVQTSTWSLEDLFTATRTIKVSKETITSTSITQLEPTFKFSTLPGDSTSPRFTTTLYQTTTVVETNTVTAVPTSSGAPGETEIPGALKKFNLSGKQIAGIVIGTVLGVLLILFIAFLAIRYHRQCANRIANNPRGAYTNRRPSPDRNGRQSPSYFDTSSQEERSFLVNEWPGILRKLLTRTLAKTKTQRQQPEPQPEEPEPRIYNPGPPPTPPVPEQRRFNPPVNPPVNPLVNPPTIPPVRTYTRSSVYSQESAVERPLNLPPYFGTNYI